MSADGAHLGVGAERALETILGGKESPGEDERESPQHVAARVLAAAERGGDPHGYGDCADMVAGMVLMFWQAHPEAAEWPLDPPYHYEKDGVRYDHWIEGGKLVDDGPDLSKAVDAFTEGKLSALGITGFQWGWAVNAARYALGKPPEQNPAIITIGGKSHE